MTMNIYIKNGPTQKVALKEEEKQEVMKWFKGEGEDVFILSGEGITRLFNRKDVSLIEFKQ